MNRSDRGQQLLTVAERVFAERGYRAASMEEVAERAGVTKPVLYDHFGSKDGLLAAVVAASHAELRELVVAAVGEAPNHEAALARGLEAYFSFIQEHGAGWAVLLTDSAASSATAGAIEAIRSEMAEFIAGLMAADLPEPLTARARMYAQVVIGASERLARVAQDVGDTAAATPGELAATVMDMIWRGLDDLRAGRRWDTSAG